MKKMNGKKIFASFLIISALSFQAFSESETAKNQPAERPLTNEEKRAIKKEEARRAREKTDDYTGHMYTIEKNPVVENDFVKVQALSVPGTFGIYAFNKDTKAQVNLLSVLDKASSTFFSLKYGKDIYQLNKSANIVSEIRQTRNSVQCLYRLPNKARLLVDFMPVNKYDDVEFDYIKGDGVVKVTMYATNLSSKKTEVGVKGVFDTYLGENGIHFKTAGNMNYDAEAKITDIENKQWVLSENSKYSIQFLLYGKGISTPKTVFLTTKENLLKNEWEPNVIENRSFNTVVSYNNSELGVNWPLVELAQNETNVIVFYIALTPIKNIEVDDYVFVAPNGYVSTPENAPFVDDGTRPKNTAVEVESAVAVPNPSVAVPPQNPPVVYNPLEKLPKQNSGSYQLEKPVYDFVLPPVTKAQLDPVYIQQLIDRIYSLQNDPQLIDKSEIRRLNAELDQILLKIRSQRQEMKQ